MAAAVEAEVSDGIQNASQLRGTAIALAAVKHESVLKNATRDSFAHLASDEPESDPLTKYTNEEAREASRRTDSRNRNTMMSHDLRGRGHMAGREDQASLSKRSVRGRFIEALLPHDVCLAPDPHS